MYRMVLVCGVLVGHGVDGRVKINNHTRLYSVIMTR